VLTEPPTQILTQSDIAGLEVGGAGLLEQTVHPTNFFDRIEGGIVKTIYLTGEWHWFTSFQAAILMAFGESIRVTKDINRSDPRTRQTSTAGEQRGVPHNANEVIMQLGHALCCAESVHTARISRNYLMSS
jgi:hypothetical protein